MSRVHCRPPYLLLLVGLLTGATGAHAYTYPFHHYTETSGLPGSAVLGMDQDRRGCLWFATRTGLACYDGSSWTHHGLERGLPMAATADVAVDHQGVVWALASSTPVRVSRLDGDRWTPLPNSPVVGWGWDTLEMELGTGPSGEVRIAVLIRGGFVTIWAQGRWHRPVLPDPEAQVRDLAWSGGTLYLATTHGLFWLDDLDDPLRVEAVAGVPSGTVLAVAPDPWRSTLQLAGPGWIGELDGGTFTYRVTSAALRLLGPEDGVHAAADDIGGVYLGDRFSLFYYNPLLGLESLTREDGLVANGVSEVLVDREGQIWLSSMRGVSKLRSRRFRNFAARDGLLQDEVSAVLQRRDGNIVLGHESGLTLMGEGLLTRSLVRADRPWGRVIDLYEDPDGTLWVAMDKSGLARIDPTGALRWYDEKDGLPGAVYALARDATGAFWAGTSVGLYRSEGQGFRRVPLATPDGSAPSVRRLALAADGTLVVACGRYGVFGLGGEPMEHWSGEEAAGYNSTYAIFERAPGRFWIGTAGGLCVADRGRLVPTRAPDPEIDHAIYSIAEDTQGRVWFGTDAGVSVWDGATLRHFGVNDGLSGSETNRDALLVDDQGRVWIGTDRGVTLYDARLEHETRETLSLWISSLEVDGEDRPLDAPVEIPAGTPELVVHFRAPAFADERRLLFQTLLEGFDADWSEAEPDPARAVRYTNLPPGDYRFKVRAMDVEGRRSPIVTTSAIIVQPPIHQRPWFVALAILMAVGLVWLVFSLVQGQRYTRRLTAEVGERTAALARSEAAVRAESRRLGVVLASISDGVLAVDAEGTVTLGNPAAARLLGCDYQLLPGTALEELLPGADALARKALRSAGRAGAGDHPHFELQRTGADGVTLGLDFAVAPLTDADLTGGLVLAFRDVTERRRAEMERIRAQKLESLGVLAGGLAHDFNNLLTVTLGNVSLLELHALPQQRELLEQIRAATHSAQRLTAQLLTFARGGAPQRRPTDLRALLRDVATLALAGTNVSLDLDLPAGLWYAEADPGQLEQVISNLLINARQAMPDGGRVRVSAGNLGQAAAGDERQVEIRIRDEGVGIAPEELERIFEPYYTTKENGTGLGLAISHSVITRHGGAVSVTSEPGVGTEFTIRLPATDPPAPAAARAEASAPAANGRLLVLDDEPFVRDLLGRMLEQLGHEATTVADGAEAIDLYGSALAEGRPYTAVIMDLTIPGGMGGREAVARLRELDPEVRAIVSSGYSQDPILADPRRFGFVATLSKPFGRRALAAVLREVLG